MALASTPSVRGENRYHGEPATATIGDTGVELPVLLDNDQPLYAFSMSITTDADRLRLVEIRLEGTDYADAEFSGGRVLDGGGSLTWAVLLGIGDNDEFDPDRVIPIGTDLHVASLVVDVEATEPATAEVRFEDVLSDDLTVEPHRLNLLVDKQAERIPVSGPPIEVAIERSEPVSFFVRGDSNGDRRVDISDAIFALNYQFLGGETPGCMDATDFDDNGKTEITDAIYLLGSLFQGGPNPPAPFPEPGIDATDDDPLDCADGPFVVP